MALSEQEKQEINEQAKKILNDFSNKLSIISDELKEHLIKRKEFERSEGENISNEFDRKIMFENAPKKNKNFILGEKAKW